MESEENSMAKKVKGQKNKYRMDLTVLVLLDLVSFAVAVKLSMLCFYPDGSLYFMRENLYFIVFTGATIFLSFCFFDLYYTLKSFRSFQKLVSLLLAAGTSFFLVGAIGLWDRTPRVHGRFLLFLILLFFGCTFISRLIFSSVHKRFCFHRAVIVGNTRMGSILADHIALKKKEGQDLGIEVVGYFSDGEKGDIAPGYSSIPWLGGYADLGKEIADRAVSLIIYALDEPGTSKVNETVIHERLRGINLISAIALFEAISGQIPHEHISSSWLIEDCLRGKKFAEVRMKRTVDIFFGSVFFLVSLPLVAFSAAAIWLESGGPVFFIQERVGRFGRPFQIYKLRTMESTEKVLDKESEGWHEKNQYRITVFGGWLRKYHIDELPQFLNVVRGEMSLVGPRPEMEMFITLCEKKIPFYRLRLAVKPGITGWAQIMYRHTSTLYGYKNKFKYDLYYLANLSLKLDLEILVRTVFRVLGYPKIEMR